MRLVNLSPHDIIIRMPSGFEKRINKSNLTCRVRVSYKQIGEVEGIPIVRANFTTIENLPDPIDGIGYIVSLLAFQWITKRFSRDDVFAPDTGDTAIRDNHGRIMAVTRLLSSRPD